MYLSWVLQLLTSNLLCTLLVFCYNRFTIQFILLIPQGSQFNQHPCLGVGFPVIALHDRCNPGHFMICIIKECFIGMNIFTPFAMLPITICVQYPADLSKYSVCSIATRMIYGCFICFDSLLLQLILPTFGPELCTMVGYNRW